MDPLVQHYLQMQQLAIVNPYLSPPLSCTPSPASLPNPFAPFPVMPFFCPRLILPPTPLPYPLPFLATPSESTPSPSSTSGSCISQKPASTPSATPKVVPGRRAMTFCRLCDKSIADQKRSQGPTRHVLKDHMRDVRIFECPHCNYYSSYDATQVVSHIKRNHSGRRADISEVVDHKKEHRAAIDAKIRECFGRGLHDAKLKGFRPEADDTESVDVVNA
ncbi:hypothetical protein QR680_004975 [Steinernema hermaphroditum]|uniref:Uncharacterized protein n=1 Tax=Steinernema hermaphroditum TaxID=289476 RepID=A0AA39LUJ4_9BILA|nr:hypothetical protein QR680_004975 [Steinernema hermaphroditum]